MMKSTYLYLLLGGFLLSLWAAPKALATHMKGGEITVRRISSTSLTYEFTLTIYCENNQAWLQQRDVLFCFGDGIGSAVATRSNGGGNGEDLGNGTWKGVYKATYTYSAPNTYRVNVAIQNRNANVRNIPNSDQIGFYVETIFRIDAGLGLNATPLLLNPAIDLTAVVGQKFIHNPNAVDLQGDSLAYRLIACRQGLQSSCTGRGTAISGFVQPDQVAASPSSFTINAITGDLIWNTPQEVGLYNCAFVIEEWRNGVKISETVRDMQIEVKDADNNAPVLKIPDDICVEAGTLIQATVTATDTPSKSGRRDAMNLTSLGLVYGPIGSNGVTFATPYATFTASAAQSPTATGTFRWQTSCGHIRQQHYDVFFKVEDLPPGYNRTPPLFPQLVDSKVWKIKIVAPRVRNLKAVGDAGARSITLTWDAYSCQNVGAELIIYRKNGCDSFVPTACQTGIPAGLGYTEIARVPISATSYIDQNLKLGQDYSYRIVASFAQPTGGLSVASDQVCTRLESAMPLITNVTVDKTSTTDGEITVKWTRPIGLNTTQFKGPYQYRLLRATGLSGATGFAQVGSNINTDLSGTTADTVFVDTKLNTQANAYRYKLLFYYTQAGSLTLLDSTEISSSVRLSTTADRRRVVLTWQANVAWSNENQTHRIYRETKPGSGIFNRIADVPVQGAATFTYTDDGQDKFAADGNFPVTMSPDSSYCYKVETVGSYNSDKIKDLLYNFSQINCATPKSDIIPCPPVLNIDALDCDTYIKNEANCNITTFNNILNWTIPNQVNGSPCDKDIVKYTLYYGSSSDATFNKLADITGGLPVPTTYTDARTDSYMGCYYVTATNKYGDVSDKSNVVCKDNCPSLALPNIFTPNGDGKNDTFQPLKCPRFVKSLTISIYNRDGQKVYEYTGNDLNWDGKDANGKEVASGSYFYHCSATFLTFDPAKASVKLKGYVEIVK